MRTIRIGILLAIGLVGTPALAQLIECGQVEARWRNATERTPFAEWVEIYDQAHNESDCDGDVVERIGLDVVAKELEPIRRAHEAGGDDATLRGLLDRLDVLQGFGSHWHASLLRGEMHRRSRQPVRALEAYRDSLALVDDEELTVTAPPDETIALLRDRLDETTVIVAQLVPSAVKLPVTRSGELVSQYRFTTRGYGRKKSLVPIQFVYAKDVMTEPGRDSFDDALKTLIRQGSPDIRVVGHTDPVGSAAYNRMRRRYEIRRRTRSRRGTFAMAAILPLVLGAGPGPADAGRKALLIGAGAYPYLSDDAQLHGPRNDVRSMNTFLVREWGFSSSDIRVLEDEEATKQGMLDALRVWLPDATEPGDRVVIYFSGHGSRVPDENGDERDEMDETFMPTDFGRNGHRAEDMLTDDELADALARMSDRQVLLPTA